MLGAISQKVLENVRYCRQSCEATPMNSEADPSMAIVIAQEILPLLPAPMRRAVELALPALTVQAARLGLEVLDAEQRGLRFSEAVQRIEFIKMQRVYFATSNLLQEPLPGALQKALRGLLNKVAAGDFDPSRKVLFAIATRRDDPEAALCRFLLWLSVRINLLIFTWSKPEVETLGVLAAMEGEAERMLRSLLDVSDLQDPDIRPLHVLIAGMLHQTRLAADQTLIEAVNQWGVEFEEVMQQAVLLERVRALDARSAATMPAAHGEEQLGSQQIVDRYPQHFDTVGAMEKQRSRVRHALARSKPKVRFIDLLRTVGKR